MKYLFSIIVESDSESGAIAKFEDWSISPSDMDIKLMNREVLYYDLPHTHIPEQDTPPKGTICVFQNMGLQSCYVTIWGEKNFGGGIKIGEFCSKEDALLYAEAKCRDLILSDGLKDDKHL